MKIIALLSFFDEKPELLTECIGRLKKIGVDTLVCVDGPYDLTLTKKLGSDFQTIKAIIDQCGGNGPDLILRNKTSWEGNEVEKRNYMLSVALAVAEEGDWLLVVDSDHMWDDLGYNLKRHLDSTTCDVAEVAFAECALDQEDVSWYEARLLNRAVPGMRYEGAHWRIRFPDGAAVSTLKAGDSRIDEPKEVLRLNDCFRVRHLKYELDQGRIKRQEIYYEGRDKGEGIER